MASNVVGKVLDQKGQTALEIALSGRFGYAWDDAGTGARQNIGFWDAGERGFWSLGSYAQAGRATPDTAMVLVRPVQPDAVKPPVDWLPVWDDESSGANEAGSIWVPVPPPGYLALGAIAKRGRDKPLVGLDGGTACVRRDLVVAAQVGPRIWDDGGSGAKRDVCVRAILAPTPDPASPVIYLTSGSFCAFPTYDDTKMKTSPAANALVLLRAESPVVKPPYPTSHGSNTPGDRIEADRLTSAVQLPCLLVQDDRYGKDIARQVEEAPFYTLEKRAVYNLVSRTVNLGAEDAEHTFTQATGISETDSRAINHTIGVAVTTQVSAEGGVAGLGTAGVSVAITASYALGITNQTDRTWSKETSHERKFVVPGESVGCLYNLAYLYTLKRPDDSEVKRWTAQTDDVAFIAYSDTYAPGGSDAASAAPPA